MGTTFKHWLLLSNAFRNSVCVSSAVALRVLHQQFSRRSPSHLTRLGMEMGNHSGLAYVVVANICTWAKPLWYVVGHTHIVAFLSYYIRHSNWNLLSARSEEPHV